MEEFDGGGRAQSCGLIPAERLGGPDGEEWTHPLTPGVHHVPGDVLQNVEGGWVQHPVEIGFNPIEIGQEGNGFRNGHSGARVQAMSAFWIRQNRPMIEVRGCSCVAASRNLLARVESLHNTLTRRAAARAWASRLLASAV